MDKEKLIKAGLLYPDSDSTIPIYDECEVHTNCTVEILRNSKTGEISIGWWPNE